MNEREIDQALDAKLAQLQRDIEPARDLWPGIAARLQQDDGAEASGEQRRVSPAWWQLGAAVVLVAASSLTTYMVMSHEKAASEHVAAVALVEHELGAERFLPASYVKARQELSAAYDDSLARLSPATRQVVDTNLREIERSLKEIGDALSRDPGNATLQQLLVAASAQELQYLDAVRRLALNVPANGA